MDQSLPPERVLQIEGILARYRSADVEFHAIRTRSAAGRSFVSMHVLVPGAWTVKQGHDLVESLEHDIATTIPGTTAFTHIEPREDPVSYRDQTTRHAIDTPATVDCPARGSQSGTPGSRCPRATAARGSAAVGARSWGVRPAATREPAR